MLELLRGSACRQTLKHAQIPSKLNQAFEDYSQFFYLFYSDVQVIMLMMLHSWRHIPAARRHKTLEHGMDGIH